MGTDRCVPSRPCPAPSPWSKLGFVLLAPLLLALAGPVAAAPSCDTSVTSAPRLGPADAPAAVDAFLDPAATNSWRTFLELRRLAADHEGELQVNVHLTSRGGPRHPYSERVRAFVTSLAGRGHLEAGLRVVARDGVERMHARLVDPASHDALAKELSIDPATIAEALRDRCARRQVATTTAHLFEALGMQDAAIARLPAFMLGDRVFDDGPSLERLRPELGRLGRHRRTYEDPPRVGPPPPMEATSERMQRPPLAGLLLGGPGLRHRFVLMARDEDDPNLFIMLPPVLRARRAHPASLAVHVVSRGISAGAEQLRHRLCAARRLGLGSAYVSYLARDTLMRQESSPVHDSLLETLDDVPKRHCKDDVDPVDLDLPDGAWLDGLPRSRPEMETLDGTLRLLGAAWRPLDLLLVSPPSEL